MNTEHSAGGAGAHSPWRHGLSVASVIAGALLLSSCGYNSTYYPTVFTPNSVAIADVDGDGLKDLVVATTADQGSAYNAGFANAILNVNSVPGTFKTGVPYPTTNANPSSIAVADLTGSGSLDLVVANAAGSVSVYLHGSAPGTFQAAFDVPTGGFPNQVVIGDVDGDGWPDLVLADLSDSGNAIVLLQDSTKPGHFLAPKYLATGVSTPSVSLGDLNGDGLPDIVATGSDLYGNNGAVYVFYQNAAHTFLSPSKFPAGAQPQSVKIADIDGDGVPDLVVANYGPGSDGTGSSGASVLLQKAGTFQAPVTLVTHGGAVDVAVADLNADGEPDLVVASLGPSPTGSVSVLLQVTVSGIPRVPVSFVAATSYIAFGFPLGVAIGDLNNDGRPDIAVADSSTATVLLQMPTGPAGVFRPAIQVGQ